MLFNKIAWILKINRGSWPIRLLIVSQGATKVLSDSPGVVEWLVGLAFSYPSLPDGQAPLVPPFWWYSSAQKKLNRERERVQNGYENANGTGTERIQNRYRKDIERISNGYGTVTDQKKRKKAFWNANYKRTRSSEHMLVSYAVRVLTKDLKTIQF